MKHRKLSKAEKRDLRDSTALLISALSLGVSVIALANEKPDNTPYSKPQYVLVSIERK